MYLIFYTMNTNKQYTIIPLDQRGCICRCCKVVDTPFLVQREQYVNPYSANHDYSFNLFFLADQITGIGNRMSA